MSDLTADLHALQTPALLLDRARLEANLGRMAERMAARGVALRPHLKTAKSVQVWRLAEELGAQGLTVSTLEEAEGFAEAGVRDQIYAVSIEPSKVGRVAALLRRGVRLRVLSDDLEACREVGRRAAAAGVELEVLIDVDSGYGRSGLDPGGEAILGLAAAIDDAPALRLVGVLTHAGHSYDAWGAASIAAVAEEERTKIAHAAAHLRGAGHALEIVSAGSTPTALCCGDLDGVTEMRPGSYMFLDGSMMALGVCAIEDVALSVLTRVISSRPGSGHVLVDAGALALSKDRDGGDEGCGYGIVCDQTGAPLDDLCVAALSQEHGWVRRRDGGAPDHEAFPVGRLLRVVPYHCCLAAACFGGYHVLAAEAGVDGYWPRLGAR